MAEGQTEATLPIQYRTFVVDWDRAGINKENRTIPLAFASETPAVQTYRGRQVREILDVSARAMDLSQLVGGPLLVNHDPSLLVGKVMSARVDADRMARAEVKFGKSTMAEEEFQNVQDGTRTSVSFGYQVNEVEELGFVDGMETVHVKSYTPFEISLATFPKDRKVGFGRTENNEQFPVKFMRAQTLLNPEAPTAPPGAPPAAPPPAPSRSSIEQAVNKARADEQTRIREINAIAEKVNHPDVTDMVETAIVEGTSIDVFRAKVLESDAFRARPVTTAETGHVGASEKELEQYSLARAILRRGENRPLDGIEREFSDEVAKRIGRKPNGFFVPADVTTRSFIDSKKISKGQQQDIMLQLMHFRALTSNVHSAGGALVGTDLLGSSLIELLRNAMFVMQMGARSLTGLVGDVAIPRQTGGATAFWLGQGAALTRTQQVVDQLGLTPHRLAASTAYDKQLLAQASVSVEAFVREDLTSVLALEKDRVAINGTGSAGEPMGIINTTGLSTPVTFGTAAQPLFTDVIKFETNLAASNADRGRLGYLVRPEVRGWLKGTPKFTNTGTPIWENDMVNGYPARATNQMPSATVNTTIFGRWDDLIVADWDGLDVLVDPYSLGLNGQISVVIQTLTDLGIRHAKSFAISSN